MKICKIVAPVLIAISAVAYSQPTAATNLNFPPYGAYATEARGIDISGVTGTVGGFLSSPPPPPVTTDATTWFGGPGTFQYNTGSHGYPDSIATCAGNFEVAGYADWFGSGLIHAIIISKGIQDIHPGAPFVESHAWAMWEAPSSPELTGDAIDANNHLHAIFWPQTTTGLYSPVDLTPASAALTQAKGEGIVKGRQDGTVLRVGISHAAYWSGTAASFVDLHPAGYASSSAHALTAIILISTPLYIEAGEATTFAGNKHAGYWFSTASSFVDINPNSLTQSIAYGISGTRIVGAFKTSTSPPHAFYYDISTGVFTDLQPLVTSCPNLGSAYTASVAYGIDANGRIVGAARGPSGMTAVEWQ